MTLRIRRILSIIFIFLFICLTPAIMLYAAGYRLGRNIFSIERTGMFIIDSKPEGAKILIDSKPQETLTSSLFNQNKFFTTPAKIKNILPGEHDVAVELDGYFSWQKKLTIYPGASTFAENILLFKNSLPAQILSAKAASASLSPDKNQILIIAGDQLTIYNLTDESQKTASQKGLAGKNIAWSEDSTKVIVGSYLFNLNDLNSKTNLGELTASSSDYKWSNNILYFRDKNSIYELSADNSIKKIISGIAFSDYLIKGSNLFIINKTNSVSNLAVYNLGTIERIKNIPLPGNTNYSFINPGHSLLNIFDNSHKILYLINPAEETYSPIVDTIDNINSANWLNGNDLLYTNDFEIWLYNLSNKQKALITRISNVINGAAMHPGKNYIIYSTQNSINAIELDEREKRNITELIKLDSVSSLAVKPDGEALYFLGKIGNQQGLYKLSIQ